MTLVSSPFHSFLHMANTPQFCLVELCYKGQQLRELECLKLDNELRAQVRRDAVAGTRDLRGRARQQQLLPALQGGQKHLLQAREEAGEVDDSEIVHVARRGLEGRARVHRRCRRKPCGVLTVAATCGEAGRGRRSGCAGRGRSDGEAVAVCSVRDERARSLDGDESGLGRPRGARTQSHQSGPPVPNSAAAVRCLLLLLKRLFGTSHAARVQRRDTVLGGRRKDAQQLLQRHHLLHAVLVTHGQNVERGGHTVLEPEEDDAGAHPQGDGGLTEATDALDFRERRQI